MISSITGSVAEIFDDSIVVDIGALGFQVFLPNTLRARLHPGEAVSLFSQLIVREDSLTLFGFETAEERKYFNLLLGVNGVGPRLALALLSSLTPDAIRRAVFQEQADVLGRVPGVGKKTAQKILLHLQDRIKGDLESLPVARGESEPADLEVFNALTALGYSIVEAQSAIQSIPRETAPDTESRLRAALQSMAR